MEVLQLETIRKFVEKSLLIEDFDEWGIPLSASNYIAEEYHQGHYIVSS